MQPHPPLLVYCQLQYGVGHWMRTRALLEALRHRFRVVLALGGRLAPELEVPDGVQVESLPAVTTGREGYIEGDEEAFLQLLQRRRRRLLEILRRERPRALLIEYFPFGRQNFAPEVVALLEIAQRELVPKPFVACSLRDLQQRRNPLREQAETIAVQLSNRYFDAILVHGDPHFVRFEDSFSASEELRSPVLYTGYVSPPTAEEGMTSPSPVAPSSLEPPRRRILVSVGGGRGGEDLLRTSVEAFATEGLWQDFSLRIIAGAMLLEDDWQDLRRRVQALAGSAPAEGLELIRWVPDLRQELQATAVSVSRCGYNTALDLLCCRPPALVVPYTTAGEDEQLHRAQRLAAAGALRYLSPESADAATLAAEIRRTAQFQPKALPLDLTGAETTTDLLEEFLARRGSLPTATEGARG